LSLILDITSISAIFSDVKWENSTILVNSGADFEIRDSHLTNTSILVDGQNRLRIFNSTLVSGNRPLLNVTASPSSREYPELVVSQSVLRCGSCQPLLEFRKNTLLNLTFEDSDISPARSLLGARRISNALIRNTWIRNFRETLFIDILSGLGELNLEHITLESADLGAELLTGQLGKLTCSDTTFTKLRLGDLSSSTIDVWEDCTSIDSPVRFPGTLSEIYNSSFSRTIYSHPSDQPFFWIEDFATHFRGVYFHDSYASLGDRVLPNETENVQFMLANGTILPDSVLSADSLWIGGDVNTYGYLAVGRALFGDWSMPKEPRLRSGLFATGTGPDSTWRFASLTLTAKAHFEGVDFFYVVSDPVGIVTPCIYPGGFHGLPNVVNAEWRAEFASHPPRAATQFLY
jgi:hypothetical protein